MGKLFEPYPSTVVTLATCSNWIAQRWKRNRSWAYVGRSQPSTIKMEPELSICWQKSIYQTNSLPILEEKLKSISYFDRFVLLFTQVSARGHSEHLNSLSVSIIPNMCQVHRINIWKGGCFGDGGEQLSAASTTAGARFKDIFVSTASGALVVGGVRDIYM